MDLKQVAKEISNLVLLAPAIAYGVLLWEDPNFLVLAAAAFIFFAFVPQRIFDQSGKLPRNPKNKARAIRDSVLSYAAGFVVLWTFNAPAAVLAFSASVVVANLLAYFITPHWMISTHSLMSVQSMTILALKGRLEAIPIFAIFLIFGWARIYLKAHTPAQYVAGGIMGAALTAMALTAAGG